MSIETREKISEKAESVILSIKRGVNLLASDPDIGKQYTTYLEVKMEKLGIQSGSTLLGIPLYRSVPDANGIVEILIVAKQRESDDKNDWDVYGLSINSKTGNIIHKHASDIIAPGKDFCASPEHLQHLEDNVSQKLFISFGPKLDS